MKQVYYSKYNSLRRPDFRIVTEIRDDNGEKTVVKRALEPTAEKHVAGIAENRKLLENYYTDIQVIPVRQEEGALVFPYIKGISLKEKLIRDFTDREELIREAGRLVDTVLSVRGEYHCSFEKTPAFTEVFGETEPTGEEAVCPANVDAILSNFMESDGKLCCIDYEWVFNFPVPLGFLRYRALRYLHYELEKSVFDGMSREVFLSRLGIDRAEQAIYEKMEYHFQYYVHGENLKYHYLHRYQKRNGDPHDVIRQLNQVVQAKNIEIEKLERQYQDVIESVYWRRTELIRKVLRKAKKTLKKNERIYLYLRYLKRIVKFGPKSAAAFRKAEIAQRKTFRRKAGWISAEETKRQEQTNFDRSITFSILVPLYNTPEKYLSAMMDSVREQTYAGWELCLADGSDAEHGYVGEICRQYAEKDSRILYRKLEKNGGISENTNACIDMATGDYIALFDHDDLLHPYALYEYMKVICGKGADFIYSDEATFHKDMKHVSWMHFKPDYAPDTLRSVNYICHFSVFRRELLDKVGRFRKAYDGSQDYDLILRLTEQAEKIVHIPQVLYYWRSHDASTANNIAAKPYTMDTGKAAIADHLKRVGLKGSVTDSAIPTTYKVQYEITGKPRISIIIPNKDHVDDLSKCLNSIWDNSTWENWEIIVVENNSEDPATFEYYKKIQQEGKTRVVRWDGEFNFSAINNYGAQFATGDYYLLLNNDTEVISPDWMEQMLMFAQREDVGAVGAMLYYPDDTVQHAGVILGIGGIAGHSHKTFKRGEQGYASRMTIAQNLSAVTGACIMVPRRVWDKVDGMDESYPVAFNDIDLCLKIRKAGYLIVWTPYAELYHYESKSRGLEDNPEKQARFKGEIDRFTDKWGPVLEKGDPYYNPNLTLVSEDFATI